MLAGRLLSCQRHGFISKIYRSHTSFRLSSTSSRSNSPMIRINSATPLYTDPIQINVENLPKNETVTLHLNLTNQLNLNYDSFHKFNTGDQGCLNLEKDKPLENSYGTIDSMSLFRTLLPRNGFDKRFWSSDVTKNYNCQLIVYKGPVSSLDECNSQKELARTNFTRLSMDEGVRRIVVKKGNVRATVFLPKEEHKPYKPVITLHGGINKRQVVEDMALSFANQGFAAMALAYFKVDGLPEIAEGFEMEYFEEAIDHFLAMDGVKNDAGVGLWGISKGGEMALSISYFLQDKIKACVAVNSSVVLFISPISYKGRSLKASTLIADIDFEIVGENVYRFKGLNAFSINDYTKDTLGMIPFYENPKTAFLFVAGDDDLLFNSYDHAKIGSKFLKETWGDEAVTNTIIYNGLGHLLDTPYAPPTQTSTHVFVPRPNMVEYGGSNVDKHSKAQEESFKTIVSFFREKIA